MYNFKSICHYTTEQKRNSSLQFYGIFKCITINVYKRIEGR